MHYYKKMAAMMMFMAMEEDDYQDKQAILAYHKKEALIRKNMTLNQNSNTTVSYGIMWYSTYRIRGVNITDYRIIATTNNINDINDRLSAVIATSLSNYDVRYLIYSVKGVDPNLVSYDVVKSSTFPHVNLIIHRMYSPTLATLTGDKKLRNSIYIPCLTNYNNYANQLRAMKKKEVKKILNGWCVVCTKKNIIRLILVNEKKVLKSKC